MQPAKLRLVYWLTLIGTVLLGGWLWFGNSGLALLGLWSLARRPWDCSPFVVDLRTLPARYRIMSPWRIVLTTAGRTREVFSDEVPESDWRRLRRHLREFVEPVQS